MIKYKIESKNNTQLINDELVLQQFQTNNNIIDKYNILKLNYGDYIEVIRSIVIARKTKDERMRQHIFRGYLVNITRGVNKMFGTFTVLTKYRDLWIERTYDINSPLISSVKLLKKSKYTSINKRWKQLLISKAEKF